METPLSSTCSTLRAVGGKSSSGFQSRTREGGCQLSAGRVPAPRQVCGPLALGSALPPGGAQVGRCWLELAMVPTSGIWQWLLEGLLHIPEWDCPDTALGLVCASWLPGHASGSSCLDTLLRGSLSSWSHPAGCLQPLGGRGAPTLAPSPPHLCHSPCRCSPLYRCSCGTRCWPGSSRGLHRGLRSRGHSLWGEAAVSGRMARRLPLGP